MGLFFSYPNIFIINQGNFFRKFVGDLYENIVSFLKRKSKYEIKHKGEKKY